MFLKAVLPTPILNTENFEFVFGGSRASLPFDGQGLVRQLEAIAFPGTIFHVVREHKNGIYEVRTSAYPASCKLFIDKRFVAKSSGNAVFSPFCPEVEKVQIHLFSLLGVPYIWGGNYSSGIQEMLAFYPPKKSLNEIERRNWIFQGVDCSGLIYEATCGFTPRNASWIANFGQPAPISEEKHIMDHILPLDAIIFREKSGGYHILFSLDAKRSIESREGKGVVVEDMQKRIQEISETKKLTKEWDHKADTFIIRRWHPKLISNAK